MTAYQDEASTVDGVRAIEMRYRAIFSTADKLPAFYQSSIRLNSPEMGVLLPERFMPVLESDDRCVSVFKLALLQTLKAAEKLESRELDFGWISVFMPLRLLHRNDCAKIVRDFTGMVKASPDRICLEISAPLIDESDYSYCSSMKQLRKAGFHTMLTDVDGESFPMMKLAELEPEYVMLNERVTRMAGMSDRSDACVRSVMSFINDLNAEAVATGVGSAETAEKLFEFDCSYYTGSESTGEFSGKFISDRFIRRRNADTETSE